ncbi:MAG: hypothetical protein U0V75_01925 [Ferruginibacter sp.]
MKLFYLLLLVFSFTSYTDAQIVNIPDLKFKQALIESGIDLNADGQIQQTEAEAKTGTLQIANPYSGNITNLTGINSFINVNTIEIFNLYGNVSSLQLDNLPNLLTLKIFETGSPSFTVSYTGTNNIKVFEWWGGGSLNFNFLNGFSNVEDIVFDHLSYSPNVVIHDLPKLKTFRNSIPPDFSITLNLYNLPLLETVNTLFQGGKVTLNNLPNLVSYTDDDSYSTGISFSGVPKLTLVKLGSLQVDSLDFSSCPKLTQLDYNNGNTKLKYLNLKNSSIQNYIQISSVAATDSLKVCADEGEVLFVQNRLTQLGFNINKILVSPFCTFTEGGTFNTIKGIVRFDGNANGCDVADDGMKQLNLSFDESVSGTFIRSTDSAGNYIHYAGKGTYTITPQFTNPYFIITPPNASVYFDSANSYLATRDFCITANGTKHDLEIAFLPTWQPARPGFNAAYALVYKNNGNTTQSGTLQMNYNAAKLNFVNESTGGATPAAGQLSWNFSNLKPFESKIINITLNVLPPTANNIGDTLLFNAVIASSNTDETPANNISNIKQPVQGSFDPNDKQCLEGNKITQTDLFNNMHYQIRFQNEGTDTASNIIVADTLTGNFDETSFRLLASSHPCTIKRKGNIIQFNFENIKLPYKAINDPASHGYVSFTVKPKNTLVAGDSLNNRASIYFDFNTPVVTNKSVTLVAPAAPLPVKFEYINGQTDGSSNTIQWKMNCSGIGVATMTIERSNNGISFEIIKTIATTAVNCQQPFTYTDNSLAVTKNYYRIKITEDNGKSYYSNTVLLQQKSNDFAVTGVRAEKNNLQVVFSAAAKKEFILRLSGTDGRLLSQKSIVINSGTTIIDLPVQNLATGIYILSVTGGGISYSQKQFINTGQ